MIIRILKLILIYTLFILVVIVVFLFWLLHRVIATPIAYYRFINDPDLDYYTRTRSHNV